MRSPRARSAIRTAVAVLASLAACAVVAPPRDARADESIIKSPSDHPLYRFEAEPHGLLGFGGPFEHGRSQLGAGFRGTIVLVDNGFIPSINNSVGIGFGGDLFFGHGVLYIPVVMQWNFWLTTHWSVFGEPGIGIAANPDKGRDAVGPVIMLGGRYHFNDRVSLTMRIGYPAISVGVSFFL
jgi:hypothetical protein